MGRISADDRGSNSDIFDSLFHIALFLISLMRISSREEISRLIALRAKMRLFRCHTRHGFSYARSRTAPTRRRRPRLISQYAFIILCHFVLIRSHLTSSVKFQLYHSGREKYRPPSCRLKYRLHAQKNYYLSDLSTGEIEPEYHYRQTAKLYYQPINNLNQKTINYNFTALIDLHQPLPLNWRYFQRQRFIQRRIDC